MCDPVGGSRDILQCRSSLCMCLCFSRVSSVASVAFWFKDQPRFPKEVELALFPEEKKGTCCIWRLGRLLLRKLQSQFREFQSAREGMPGPGDGASGQEVGRLPPEAAAPAASEGAALFPRRSSD